MRSLQAAPPPQPPPFHVQHEELPVFPLGQEQPQPRPQPSPPRPPPPRPSAPRYMDDPPNALQVIATARAIGAIAATRLLLLLVLICAAALWGLTVWDPIPYRIASAGIFSAMVVWPLVMLAMRKG